MTQEPMEGSRQPGENTVLDPVCGMHVNPQTARGSAEYQGKPYYFCSSGCVARFTADPQRYLSARPPAAQMIQIGGIAPAPKAPAPMAKVTTPEADAHAQLTPGKGTVTYVCPMDPEVRE